MGFGLGQTSCGPSGVLVPDDEYPIPESPSYWAALVGLALGFGVGWWLGQPMRKGAHAWT